MMVLDTKYLETRLGNHRKYKKINDHRNALESFWWSFPVVAGRSWMDPLKPGRDQITYVRVPTGGRCGGFLP